MKYSFNACLASCSVLLAHFRKQKCVQTINHETCGQNKGGWDDAAIESTQVLLRALRLDNTSWTFFRSRRIARDIRESLTNTEKGLHPMFQMIITHLLQSVKCSGGHFRNCLFWAGLAGWDLASPKRDMF